MGSSQRFITRIQARSLYGVAVVVDRGLRLRSGALRNADQAVASDLVNARARTEAAAAIAASAQRWPVVTLRGA